MPPKTIPLKTNRRVLIWFSLYPPDVNTGPYLKLAYLIFSLSIFSVNICGLVSSVAFFLEFISISLEESLYCVFQIAGIGGVICIVTNAYFSRIQMIAIFKHLENIYKACEIIMKFNFPFDNFVKSFVHHFRKITLSFFFKIKFR